MKFDDVYFLMAAQWGLGRGNGHWLSHYRLGALDSFDLSSFDIGGIWLVSATQSQVVHNVLVSDPLAKSWRQHCTLTIQDTSFPLGCSDSAIYNLSIQKSVVYYTVTRNTVIPRYFVKSVVLNTTTTCTAAVL